ncbi:hypothetical protein [Pseudobacter ginsenosidimutans]|uniref:Uncharacterized protein n=1 Tax=Pseudobacter ginsenosidimutans TaxID=661488 RepID=A0A4Q7MRB0_9BACT|nr:hypothetical protein [Pseudobacter ginsenosidimutans]QEC45756.1 hypothetical protein FSB84_30205 [Pseudobacter ginsenosidimutans]RZS69299.1 hypothetical protein EV199_5136 [Pseudobacter ginsenosidimutans]
MKSFFYITTVWLLVALLATGCKKEGALTASPEPENIYGDPTLPQGNHPYDATILEMFKKYRTLFLYKYEPKDIMYNVTWWIGGRYDAVANKTTAGYFDVPANEDYVDEQLALINETLLKYYSESLLRAGLPQKVFLLDSFYFARTGAGKPSENVNLMHEAYAAGDFMIVGYGGSRINAISAPEKYALKSKLNSLFLANAHAKNAIKRQAAFTALTDYDLVDYWTAYEQGVIDYLRKGVEEDWDVFMETIVSNSYASLTAPGGLLHPSVDVNGLIKKKYDIVISYFLNTFGIDLQAIGNEGA